MASWLKLLQLLLSNILMVLLFVFEDPINKQIMDLAVDLNTLVCFDSFNILGLDYCVFLFLIHVKR